MIVDLKVRVTGLQIRDGLAAKATRLRSTATLLEKVGDDNSIRRAKASVTDAEEAAMLLQYIKEDDEYLLERNDLEFVGLIGVSENDW